MKIEAGKTYLTRDGRKVRILCTDVVNDYSVVGAIIVNKKKEEKVIRYTKCGNRHKDTTSKSDLVSEYSIWDNVEVDTPIFVKKIQDKNWKPRYFAKHEDGKVFAWAFGKTSFTTDSSPIMWECAKLAKDKEDKCSIK